YAPLCLGVGDGVARPLGQFLVGQLLQKRSGHRSLPCDSSRHFFFLAPPPPGLGTEQVTQDAPRHPGPKAPERAPARVVAIEVLAEPQDCPDEGIAEELRVEVGITAGQRPKDGGFESLEEVSSECPGIRAERRRAHRAYSVEQDLTTPEDNTGDLRVE